MRVIGGTARGLRLEVPKGTRVRPTLDRVRESLFNILSPHLAEARFLDLFAGSGANGIEALSRGAAHSAFVDDDARSLTVVRHNLSTTGLAKRSSVHRLSLPTGLTKLSDREKPFGLVFADPPYIFEAYEKLLRTLREAELLVPDGLVVLEHATRVELPEELSGYRRYRQAKYGEASLSFFS